MSRNIFNIGLKQNLKIEKMILIIELIAYLSTMFFTVSDGLINCTSLNGFLLCPLSEPITFNND